MSTTTRRGKPAHLVSRFFKAMIAPGAGFGTRPHPPPPLPVWREARKFYSEQEQAALELTEAITLISADHVPDEVYDVAAGVFDDKDLAQLIALIITINAWTRIGVTGRMEPGH